MKTGIVEFILSNVGSKSEKIQPFLRESDGNLVEIFKESDNPFENESLKEYEGKTVTVTGQENEYGLFIIDTIEVIVPEAESVETNENTVQQLSDVEEEPIQKTVITEETEKEEITEEKTLVSKPELKGFRKLLAFFHRK